MDSLQNRQKTAKSTRNWRKVHYYIGLSLAFFLLISALTGWLLSWKKEVDLLQPPTQSTLFPNEQWLSIDSIQVIGSNHLKSIVGDGFSIDRLDVRPDKGIVKVLFIPGYWEVQIDGKSGAILSTKRRYSDLIEQIHDGSIISDGFKLLSMNMLSIGILFSIFSGLWLWYGPRKIRKLKNKT